MPYKSIHTHWTSTQPQASMCFIGIFCDMVVFEIILFPNILPSFNQEAS